MMKTISRFLILTFLLENFAVAIIQDLTITAPRPSDHSMDDINGVRCEDLQSGLSLNLRNVGLRRLDSNFTKSPYITCLNLEDNDIAHISPSSFNFMPRLHYLNLARNSFSLTNFSKLDKHPHLRTLILDGNLSNESVILEFLNTFSELSYLHFHNCNIKDIVSLSFAQRLMYLNLSSNNLGSSKFNFLKHEIPFTLISLDLANNGIENLNASTLSWLEKLRLDGNKFERLCGKSYCSEAVLTLGGATKLKWFSASNNAFTSVDSDAFDDTVNIEHLDLSHNKIDSIHKGTFEVLEELKYLSLEDNLLKMIPELCNLESLRHLSLAKNILQEVNNDVFCQIENLTFVDLSDNKIKLVEDGAFDKLTRLEVLKLSNNLLTTFASSWLRPLRDLRSLYVDANRLKSLSDLSLAGVHVSAKLKYVFAQNNLIDKLYAGSLLNEVGNPPNVTIQLFDFNNDARKDVSGEEDCKCDCSYDYNEISLL